MIRQVARQVYLFSTFQTLKSLNLLSKIGGGGDFSSGSIWICVFLNLFQLDLRSYITYLPNQTKTDIKLNRLKKKCKFL